MLLAVRMRVRLAAACYTYSRATYCCLLLDLVVPNEYKRFKKHDIFAICNICYESLRCEGFDQVKTTCRDL